VLTPLLTLLRTPRDGDTLEAYWHLLTHMHGFGSFLAGQVVADLKHFGALKAASDWDTFAPLGPGSMRGLNRYHQRPLRTRLSQTSGLVELQEIREVVSQGVGLELAVHNVQNCMCEYDKYLRLKYEGGRVRAKYSGSR
jgi:hypothetical protein